MVKRLILAYLIAPAVPSLLDGLLSIARSNISTNAPLDGAPIFSPFLTIISYLCAGLIGIPLYLILRRHLGNSWWKYVLLGSFIGGVPALLLIMTLNNEPSGLGPGIVQIAALIGPYYGAIGGLAFWIIGIAELKKIPNKRVKNYGDSKVLKSSLS